ncbi:hypothetical protein [Nannocystis pusilla]|uniref:hypothetical protein n=1 Tax=Nannocystis pusilla TaxID=889268 RepID=UPI003DA2B177
MDAVYAELLGYEVGGGGDHAEHVGRGLEDALDRMQWSDGDKVLKLVFLVGDAPPHDDYQDAPTTAELAKRAAQRGIILNTVQCGVSPEAETAWRAIAAATNGEYSQIAQNGGVVAVATPYDGRLQELNNQLSATVLTWGSHRDKLSAQVKLGNRMAMTASAAAEAASYSAKVGRMNSEDLLGALDGGQALTDIPNDQLPERHADDDARAAGRARRRHAPAAVRPERADPRASRPSATPSSAKPSGPPAPATASTPPSPTPCAARPARSGSPIDHRCMPRRTCPEGHPSSAARRSRAGAWPLPRRTCPEGHPSSAARRSRGGRAPGRCLEGHVRKAIRAPPRDAQPERASGRRSGRARPGAAPQHARA